MSTSAIQVLLPESPWLGFIPPCTASDPELFFAESPVDLELAKTVCAECPIRKECLEGALERHEPYGVWGGELIIAGVIVARKRPRGRPRKTEKEVCCMTGKMVLGRDSSELADTQPDTTIRPI